MNMCVPGKGGKGAMYEQLSD